MKNKIKNTLWIKLIFIHIVCAFLASVLIGLYVIKLDPTASELEMMDKINSLSVSMTCISWFLTMIGCFIIAKKQKMKLKFNFNMKKLLVLMVVLLAIAFAFVQFAIWNIGYMYLFNVNISEVIQFSEVDTGINLFIVAFFVPVAEEFFFRGYLLDSLLEKMKTKQAILLQGLAFAFFQGSFIMSIYYFVFGCVLGYLCVKMKTVIVSLVCRLSFSIFSLSITEKLLIYNNQYLTVVGIMCLLFIIGCLIGIEKTKQWST